MIQLFLSKIGTMGLSKKELRDAEHFLGIKLLRYVLLHRFGMREPLPEIVKNERGKPCLSDRSLEFNISHSEGMVVLALSDTPVGVDIEPMYRRIPNTVSKRFFGKEQATVKEWTEFESYGKFLGIGIDSSLFCPAEGVHFKTYCLFPDFTVCVCTRETVFPDDIEQIQL